MKKVLAVVLVVLLALQMIPFSAFADNQNTNADKTEIIVNAEPTAATDETVPAFKTQSLILSGQIGVNFFLELPEISGVDYSQSYMEFTIGKDPMVYRDPFDPSFMNSTRTRYGFSCFVNSIQIADTITAVYHYGDGETVSKEYSVLTYLQTVEKNADLFNAKTLALVRSIADYGHYAQIYLSEVNGWCISEEYSEMSMYNMAAFDYDVILSDVSEKGFVKMLEGSKVSKATYRLHLDSTTTVDVFLTASDGVAPTDVTLTIHEEETGMETTKPVTPEKQADGRYMIQISEISAHKLGDMMTICGTAGKVFTVQVCALSYVRSVLNNTASTEGAKNCLASMYAYYAAVRDYRK